VVGLVRNDCLWRSAIWASIAALVGCGPSSQVPAAATGAQDGFAAIESSNIASSRMRAVTSNQDLLYITSEDRGAAYVYSYPQRQLVGTLPNLSGAAGECTDAAGDVFITTANQSGSGTIYEYTHGGTSAVETLTDPGEANGCAVDPKTGNLAVANSRDESNPYYPYRGDLAVYSRARGSPKMHYSRDPAIAGFDFCGYDDKGDLYLSAGDEYQIANPLLVRLPSGGTGFERIALNVLLYSDQGGASVQWDGRHMAVSSSERGQPMLVYRLRISGKAATVIGKTELESRTDVYNGQIWIQGKTVIGFGPYKRGYENAYFWPYPAGGPHGPSTRKVGGVKQTLWGVTVSAPEPR
jgi:hypothetical protein